MERICPRIKVKHEGTIYYSEGSRKISELTYEVYLFVIYSAFLKIEKQIILTSPKCNEKATPHNPTAA